MVSFRSKVLVLCGLGSLLLTSCSQVRLMYAFSVQGGNSIDSPTNLDPNAALNTNPLIQPIPLTDINGLTGTSTSQGNAANGGQANLSTGTGNSATSSGGTQPNKNTLVPASAAPASSAPLSLNGLKLYFANASVITLSKQGESTKLNPVVTDAQGNLINAGQFKIVYESSDPQSFSVDANGVVTALKASGNVSVTAKLVDNPSVTSSLQVGMGSSGDSPAPTDPNAFDGVQGIIDFS